MRLRPFGRIGPLTVGIAALETYLVRHGRDWERYAYLKARLLSGEEYATEVFDEIITPFVYRRYLDYGVFDALRQMKALITQEVTRKDMAENIKLGPGGIREIEFIVQALQLFRGGRDPALHFAAPALPNQNAGVQGGVGVATNPMSGSATISAAQAADLQADLWYLNLHTGAFGGGEIRGQVVPEPSTFLLAAFGLLGLLGQPVFHLVWRFGFPQPYENLTLRMVAGLSCLPLILRNHWPPRWEGALGSYWMMAVFFNLPFLFSFFLLQNALSQVWVFSVMGGMFFLTFLVRLEMSVILFFSGTALAYGVHAGLSPQPVALRDYLQVLVLSLFPMLFGGVVNYQLLRARELQRAFEVRLRKITVENANLVKEQNQLLSRFGSNSIITRLRRFQTLYGLEEALHRMTRQEKRFCAIMQADVRNFTKMFGQDS